MRTTPLAKAALFVALAAVAVVAYLFLLSVFRGKLGAFSSAVAAMVMALLALILNWRFFRYEKQSLAEIGFNQPSLRIREAVAGFAAGCVLVLCWVLALRIVTSSSWKMSSFDSAAASGAITFIIFNNAAEEFVYRAYLFLLLARSYGRTIAVIVTCGLFTLLHIQGGVPWPSAVAGVLTSALIFAAIFVRWQSLPLVLSFHVATNFMQELLGLRITGLTLFGPMQGTNVTVAKTHTILLIIGLVNIIVAFVIFRSAQKLTLRTSASSADTASSAGSPGMG